MTKVVEFSSHLQDLKAKNSVASGAGVVTDLVALSAGVREAVEKMAELTGLTPQQLKDAVQHLVDALSSLEAASNVLTEDGDWVPF
jgi:hypothetical protein